MTPYKDRAVVKFTNLLREVPQDIRDEVVARAKDRLVAEAKKAKKEDLEKLFDSQIQTLRDRGCPEQIVEMLRGQKVLVIQKAGEMTLGQGNIPFIPVIPRTCLSPYSLMAMVKNGDKKGYTYLNSRAITDEVVTPEDPYYIYDVEDCEAMLGKAPQDAEKAIEKQGRFILTAAETMALCTHGNVLLRHYVDATGSRHGSPNKVPYVFLAYGVRPELHRYDVDGADLKWGSPSCGSR